MKNKHVARRDLCPTAGPTQQSKKSALLSVQLKKIGVIFFYFPMSISNSLLQCAEWLHSSWNHTTSQFKEITQKARSAPDSLFVGQMKKHSRSGAMSLNIWKNTMKKAIRSH